MSIMLFGLQELKAIFITLSIHPLHQSFILLSVGKELRAEIVTQHFNVKFYVKVYFILYTSLREII